MPPFDLLETMRMDAGVVHRLELHLQRLAESVAYWGFEADTAEHARLALARLAAQRSSGSWRVRLTADRNGTIDFVCSELHEPFVPLNAGSGNSPNGLRVALARSAVAAQNRLLFHKTTARAMYESRRAGFADVFDVLLFNDQGMVTEFTFGNVVALLDGRMVTPPHTHGLLAGTYRQELIQAGVITEAPISLAQLRTATRLFHINSVRGATEVRLDLGQQGR
jgi:para-aminobenzoate synthetase / 4-amino-4-deoxychorismate lyase